MSDLRSGGVCSCVKKGLSLAMLLAFLATGVLGANNITGSVRNQTRREPAVGDEVILVRLDRGMPEEARAETDAQGAFTLNVQHPDKPYLVRVFHQGVSYDQPASSNDLLSIEVFDAARRVRGLTASIEILRAGTNGNLLHVSDLVELKNESKPPLTQAGERTFQVYLPSDARIDSVLAAGPGETGVVISAAPVPGEPGSYTLNFPLRPGATKFAFNYDVPYHGHAAFNTRREYPLRQLAIMIPPAMKFSSRSPAFKILTTGNDRYQVETANELTAGEGPEFELSGTGALPPLSDQVNSQAPSQSPAAPNSIRSAPTRAGLPSVASMDSRLRPRQPLSQPLVLAGVTSVLLAACAFLVWRGRKRQKLSAAQIAAPQACPRQRSAA
jgi:hypothetical protein